LFQLIRYKLLKTGHLFVTMINSCVVLKGQILLFWWLS